MVGNFYFHFPFSLSFCLFQFNSGPVLISPTWKLRTTPHLLRSTMAAKIKHKNKNKKTVNKHHRFLFHNPPPIVGATGANTDDDLDVKVFPPSSLLFRPRFVSSTEPTTTTPLWPHQRHRRKPPQLAKKPTTNQHHKPSQATTVPQPRQHVSIFFSDLEATLNVVPIYKQFHPTINCTQCT